MSWLTVAGIYFVVWWLCLFIILPIGVRTQDEDEETILGTVGSAPTRHMMVRKALATTVAATAVTGLLFLAFNVFDISLTDFR